MECLNLYILYIYRACNHEIYCTSIISGSIETSIGTQQQRAWQITYAFGHDGKVPNYVDLSSFTRWIFSPEAEIWCLIQHQLVQLVDFWLPLILKQNKNHPSGPSHQGSHAPRARPRSPAFNSLKKRFALAQAKRGSFRDGIPRSFIAHGLLIREIFPVQQSTFCQGG